MGDSNQQFSSEDLAALYHTQQQLEQAGDPRAEKIRQFISTQGRAQLHPEEAEKIGTLGKIWNWANEGLVSKDTMVRAMSGMTPEQLDAALASYDKETPVHAAVREFVRGSTQDTAGVGSSFTSPLAIAMMGAGEIAVAGKAANTLAQTGEALNAAQKTARVAAPAARALNTAAGVGFGVKGAGDVYDAGLENTPEAWQKRLQGASQIAIGAQGGVEKIAPEASTAPISELPGRAKSGAQEFMQKVQTNARNAASKVLPALVDGPPEQMVTRAVKPRKTNDQWEPNLKEAMPQMKAAEHELGKPIENIDDALEAAKIAKQKLWRQYEERLGPNKNAEIDGNQIADSMMRSINKRSATQHPELVDRIQKVADTYRRPLTLDEAEEFLQSANDDLHGYYAKNKVGREVAMNDPEKAYVVAEAGSLRKALYSRLDDLTGLGAQTLKRQYGALSNIQEEMTGRKNVSNRQNQESLAEQISTARGYGKIAKGVFTMSPGDVMEGAETIGTAKYLKQRNTADAMLKRAFAAYQTPEGYQVQGPVTRDIRGLLPQGPTMAGPVPDTSGSVPEGYRPPAYEATTRAQRLGLLLPEKTSTPLGPSLGDEPMQVKNAKWALVRDPRTGRMRKMFVTASAE